MDANARALFLAKERAQRLLSVFFAALSGSFGCVVEYGADGARCSQVAKPGRRFFRTFLRGVRQFEAEQFQDDDRGDDFEQLPKQISGSAWAR